MNNDANYIYYFTIIHFAQKMFRKRKLINNYLVWLHMAGYARKPSTLMWLCANSLINSLYKQISCKTCLLYVVSYARCFGFQTYHKEGD